MSETDEIRRCCGDLPAKVRERQPLVHLLTNYVTVNDCVNAVLAIGGRVICSHAPEEAAQVTCGADALVCNLGGTEYYDAMDRSLPAAVRAGIPIVIDPVGCAASSFRRERCFQMMKASSGTSLCVVRGNYAEIEALISGSSDSPGLDSPQPADDRELSLLEHRLEKRMLAFSRRTGVMLIASGETDLCTDGTGLREIHCGTPALRRITGSGCLSSAVLGAFLAAEPTLEGAAAAVSLVGLAGETALRNTREGGFGAGHFHMFLMDALSTGDPVWKFTAGSVYTDTPAR